MSLKGICLLFQKHSRFYSSKYKLSLSDAVTPALRAKKSKSNSENVPNYFSDTKSVRVVGGKGGNGCISFLQLWCNERAGPDGGDGGNGGHVIFESSKDVRNLNHLCTTIRGEDGQCGTPKECHGKNSKHTITKVPIGTIIRNKSGVIIGDLDREHMMFVASRGGAGGKGNRFFTTEKENSPKVCEHGPPGEDFIYILEMRSMADIGIVGFPNAGKSTLINAITRTRSKVAPYAFTTIHPQIGMVQYADHFQLAVADLPGIIPGSHRNKGLGLQFLKHVERCSSLIYLLDASAESPWLHYENLNYEMFNFNKKLTTYPKIIVANKIDKPEAIANLSELKNRIDGPVIGISAKDGTNLQQLLNLMRLTCEDNLS
ncbi:mitochondrial ribosome-associated GTPase 2 [Calliphora vicina]|uniref:mitochondrial ribosome-associated GTPase 2 n=1 Tax=Calliphora vicina TaxID=7373 RepID=UPI00325B1A10